MQTVRVEIDRDAARQHWKAYLRDRHYAAPIDEELKQIFWHISQGRMIVRAIESIRVAGLYSSGPYEGLPKLALCRLDARACHVWLNAVGAATYTISDAYRSKGSYKLEMPPDFFPRRGVTISGWSLRPPVPAKFLPARAHASYFVLWEAEWSLVPPGDPLLLRRIGKSDAWLVVAAWDLTDAERAVFATRLNA